MTKFVYPFLIFMSGALVSALLFAGMRRNQNQNIWNKINSEASNIRSEIQLELESRVRAIERLNRRIEFRKKLDMKELEADAFAIYRHLPGFQAFEFADEKHIVQWSYPIEGNQDDLFEDLSNSKKISEILDDSTKKGGELIVSPVELKMTGYGLIVVGPVLLNDQQLLGHFLGILRMDSFFNSLQLSDHMFINVTDHDYLVYSNEQRSEGAHKWARHGKVGYSNIEWNLSFVPTKDFITKSRDSLPLVVFISSIIGTLLLVLVFYQLQQKHAAETQLAEERIQSEAKAMHSAKLASIGEIAAGIAHEINNPLTIVKGFGHRIRQHVHPENENPQAIHEILKALEIQDTAIDRIVNIVSGLRTFARVDSSHIELINIHQVILDTISLVDFIYKNADVRISLNLNADKTFVMGNTGKLQQVFMNLLSNAGYALRNSIHKNIVVESYNEGNFIVLKFSDNGCGIPDENLHKVFEPFFTTKPPGEGTGLGLGIAYGIVTEMKGSIEVESELNVGSTFTLTIPAQDTPHTES